MSRLCCLIVIMASLILIIDAVDYCRMNSCRGEPHTMCLFPTRKPGAACGKLHSNLLTPTDKQNIVIAHNKWRKIVASGKEKRGKPGPQPAGVIPALAWDEGLAIVAQRWANQCDFNHDKCRDTAKFIAGQNLAIHMASDSFDQASITDMIQMWYDEVKDFNRNDVKKFKFGMDIGHYTQLIWGTTTHVGCGIARYHDGESFTTYLVCNYGPTGNWLESQIYKTKK